MGAALRKITDEQLIEAYMEAIENEYVNREFIELLEQELKRRNLTVNEVNS